MGVVPTSGQRTDSIISNERKNTKPERSGIGWGHSCNKEGEIAADQIGGDSPYNHFIGCGPKADEADQLPRHEKASIQRGKVGGIEDSFIHLAAIW